MVWWKKTKEDNFEDKNFSLDKNGDHLEEEEENEEDTHPKIELNKIKEVDELEKDKIEEEVVKEILENNQEEEGIKNNQRETLDNLKKIYANELKDGKLIEEYGDVVIYRRPRKLPLYLTASTDTKGQFGALQVFLNDDFLEEVMYVAPDKNVIVYHRKYGMCDTTIFLTEEESLKIINQIAAFVGKKVDKEHALLDGRLPDGSRVNATVRPASPDGPSITIRKFRKDPFTIIDLIEFGTVDVNTAAFLWMVIEGLQYKSANILIAGGTGSGKTTTLNVMGMFIPKVLRTITIEDTAELQLEHDHWIRLEAVPPTPESKELSINDLLRNSLRMRPDRIIVGEVRGDEAKTMFTAMNTGHDGTMGTVHANTAQETITRLTSPPMSVPPVILTALDLIVMQVRTTIDGKPKRKITEIAEVGGLEGERPRLNIIYKFNEKIQCIAPTGAPSRLREEISKKAGITPHDFDKIMAERANVLKELWEKSKTNPAYRGKELVCKAIQEYYKKNKLFKKESGILKKYSNVILSYEAENDINRYNVDFKSPLNDPQYGKLTPLLEDDELEEVMYIDDKHPVKVYHRDYGMCDTNVFITSKELTDIITNLAKVSGKRVDSKFPLLDTRLKDGSRVNATLPPASPNAPTLTIRKFRKDPLTIVDLIKFRTLDANLSAHLWLWVEGLRIKPANILIAGGTSCGKTTTLNIMGMFCPIENRLITIEETMELQLRHKHWIRLETVPPDIETGKGEVTADDLLKNTLRMRPDRIIVGEVRGPEARTMFLAMNTGHDGSLGTLHSNSAQETITRLINPPMNVPVIMLTGLDMIIMQQRINVYGKTIRRITEVAEIGGFEQNRPTLTTIFKWDPQKDILVETGVPGMREKLCRAAGISVKAYNDIHQERQRIIEQMVQYGIRDINSVTEIIQEYYDKKKGM